MSAASGGCGTWSAATAGTRGRNYGRGTTGRRCRPACMPSEDPVVEARERLEEAIRDYFAECDRPGILLGGVVGGGRRQRATRGGGGGGASPFVVGGAGGGVRPRAAAGTAALGTGMGHA